MKKVVLTYGTFDLFHVGHVRLLKRLKEMGDLLYVGVSSDEFNKTKGKSSFNSYSERAEIVGSCRYVDHVFPENNWDQKQYDIEKYQVNIFAMGDDWKGEFNDLSSVCEVRYLPRTESISTTEIKRSLSNIDHSKIDILEESLHDMVQVVKALKS